MWWFKSIHLHLKPVRFYLFLFLGDCQYMATSKKSVAKKVTSRKPTTKAKTRGPVARPVMGQKILKNGKLGAVTNFASARIAAAKVAPDVRIESAVRYINYVIAGRSKAAYGYVWSL